MILITADTHESPPTEKMKNSPIFFQGDILIFQSTMIGTESRA